MLGLTESAVRNTPYTVYGWRPISTTYQPASRAMKPDGASSRQPSCSQRPPRVVASNSQPRFHAHSEASTSSSIAMPSPTITRNA